MKSVDLAAAERGPFTGRYECVFLTGCTGVLGANILKELLHKTSTHIYCLVRATSTQQAIERIQNLLSVYDPELTLKHALHERVTPILGDVTQPQLGMSPELYKSVAADVDIVLHSAASTNLFARYKQVEPINIGGTRNMIEFTLQTPNRYMTYVSTYTVLGDKTFDPQFIFRESHYDVGQGFAHMAYQESKFKAEGLVRAARERGLVWNIVRPGQIFGESTTGYYPQGQTNVSGLFYDIFKSVIETKLAFISEKHFDITPVDYVSQGILALAMRRQTYFETYHLTNPDIKTYTQACKLLSNLGYDIEFIPQEDYRKMLFAREIKVNGEEYRSYTMKALRWWYTREGFDFSKSAITDCSYTQKILEPMGVRCAKLDERLMGTYIHHGVGVNYFPARTTSDVSFAAMR